MTGCTAGDATNIETLMVFVRDLSHFQVTFLGLTLWTHLGLDYRYGIERGRIHRGGILQVPGERTRSMLCSLRQQRF